MCTSKDNGHNTLRHNDYDLHGIVGIRLLGAAPADVSAVTRQIGPIQSPLTREPDIVVRFVDQLSTSGMRYLEIDKTGFTEDAFLILSGRRGVRARAQIAFEQIGKQCEIICETGASEVPLLVPILNLTALSKGLIPLHASAFNYNGTGVLATGWTKGGKTETLLALAAKGAEYIGDEWIYISSDGKYMYGIPQPIVVWDWHLQDLPQYRTLIGRRDHTHFGIVKLIQFIVRSMSRVMTRAVNREFFLAKMINRIIPLLRRRLNVSMSPQKLFGKKFGKLQGNLEKILFVVSHETPDVKVQPVESQEIARRMVFSVQYELQDMMSYYKMFRFAFPEMRNEFIEQTENLLRAGLMRALADKEAYVIYHPYPVPIPALSDAVSSVIG